MIAYWDSSEGWNLLSHQLLLSFPRKREPTAFNLIILFQRRLASPHSSNKPCHPIKSAPAKAVTSNHNHPGLIRLISTRAISSWNGNIEQSEIYSQLCTMVNNLA
jgi:hypothetical protein